MAVCWILIYSILGVGLVIPLLLTSMQHSAKPDSFAVSNNGEQTMAWNWMEVLPSWHYRLGQPPQPRHGSTVQIQVPSNK